MRNFFLFLVLSGIFFLFLPVAALAKENIVKQEVDSNGDGRFDTVYHFQEGRLFSCARDTDGDGKVNVWQTYKDNKPVEKKVDEGIKIKLPQAKAAYESIQGVDPIGDNHHI